MIGKNPKAHVVGLSDDLIATCNSWAADVAPQRWRPRAQLLGLATERAKPCLKRQKRGEKKGQKRHVPLARKERRSW